MIRDFHAEYVAGSAAGSRLAQVEALRQVNMGQAVSGLLGVRAHALFISSIYLTGLYLSMFRLSDVWVCRTRRKKIIRQNNVAMLLVSAAFALIITLVTGSALYLIFRDPFRYPAYVAIQLSVAFTCLFLFYLSISQVFQLLYYLFFSYAKTLLATVMICAITYFAQQMYERPVWPPMTLLDLLGSVWNGATAGNHYALYSGAGPLLLQYILETVMFVLAAEVVKNITWRRKDFVLTEKVKA